MNRRAGNSWFRLLTMVCVAAAGAALSGALAGCNVGSYGLNPDDPYYGTWYDGNYYVRPDGTTLADP